MNTYNPKHILKFLLPLFVLLTGCGFPGTDNSSTKVATETPTVISYSPTPIASLVTQMPTETIAPTFTPTSTPTTTFTSTPTPTETPTLLPTQTNTPNPPSVTQNHQNSSINPSSPENPAAEALPNTGSDVGPTDTAGAGDPPGVIEGFFVPDDPEEARKKTPTPECLVCTAD